MKKLLPTKTIITLAMMVFCFLPSLAQYYRYSVAVTGSITTSSRLYFNPNDADPLVRSQNYSLNGVWGFGIDIRRAIKENSLYIGVSWEYLQVHETLTDQDNNGLTIPIEMGYRAFPLEVSGYFSIPLNSDFFSVYIGGGCGIYFGERHYTYAGIPSRVTERNPGLGIHVISGMEFSIASRWAVRTDLKFRDVQFESTNVFPTLNYDPGFTLPYNGEPFTSRVNIDGMEFTAGLVFKF